jgi:hypothetical protein
MLSCSLIEQEGAILIGVQDALNILCGPIDHVGHRLPARPERHWQEDLKQGDHGVHVLC